MYTFDGCKGRVAPALSSDDRLLISGSSNGDIIFWYTFSGADEDTHPTNPDNSVKVAKTHATPVTAVCFNSDDTIIASGSENGSICIRTANEDILAQSK